MSSERMDEFAGRDIIADYIAGVRVVMGFLLLLFMLLILG